MESKTFWLLGTLIVALFAVQAMAQTPTGPMAPSSIGAWQIISGGGDGGSAFKMNTATGESYFCYRQNCFRSVQHQ